MEYNVPFFLVVRVRARFLVCSSWCVVAWPAAGQQPPATTLYYEYSRHSIVYFYIPTKTYKIYEEYERQEKKGGNDGPRARGSTGTPRAITISLATTHTHECILLKINH
jgi:hypothetical protein